LRKHWSDRTAGAFAPGSSTGYAGSVRSHAPATLPGSVGVGVGAGVVGVGAGVALSVADGRGVGFVGVSGSAVTVGIGSVGPGWTVPVAVAVTVGDSTADVVCGVVPLHAVNVRPSTTTAAAEAIPPRRS
jgi:hypothetical protein